MGGPTNYSDADYADLVPTFPVYAEAAPEETRGGPINYSDADWGDLVPNGPKGERQGRHHPGGHHCDPPLLRTRSPAATTTAAQKPPALQRRRAFRDCHAQPANLAVVKTRV
jgi:hypothetical protein